MLENGNMNDPNFDKNSGQPFRAQNIWRTQCKNEDFTRTGNEQH